MTCNLKYIFALFVPFYRYIFIYSMQFKIHFCKLYLILCQVCSWLLIVLGMKIIHTSPEDSPAPRCKRCVCRRHAACKQRRCLRCSW